ncbi:Hsp70 family protein [Akkermansiaceae bacterium]|nr:Hsp70 family protein [Akkermansiaceae bacterium]MDB4277268.1 Hsp70 family protein [bacterium]MDB4265905.1 Hsp70 family protein [Akkermansiaceae bacterium]MDB4282738.1 Hsp70 family protein [Akkermansiaceae bacterium]MDB4310215.1 Hsp70 family protein [Akkermansiaceae bacterium]
MSHIGIDLGTTFSAAAQIDDTGRPVIINNPNQEQTKGYGNSSGNITPSCIAINKDGNGYRIGANPQRMLNSNQDAVGRFKRDMGTDKIYTLGGKELSPTELSGIILHELKKIAEAELGDITSAVVTVPANFTNEAREATLAAAKKVGLNVEYIINEPTAAAFYYAFKSGGDLSGTYAIYDLGGGTFDVTILKIAGKNIEVLCSNGVSTLGGDDFDALLVDVVKKKYKELTGVDLDPSEYTKTEAESDKILLSSKAKVLAAGDELGGEIVQISKNDFEEAISSLIAQTEMLCESTLDEANLKKTDISEIILAGGSTRIPAVRESIIKTFGKKPLDDENVDEVVALGAALYAAYKSGGENLNAAQRQAISSIKLQEVTGFCFGTTALHTDDSTGEKSLRNFTVIKKNTKIPVSHKEVFFTVRDNQTSVSCDVTQSTHEESDPNYVKTIWEGSLDGLPTGRPAGHQIDIMFSFDDNNVMHCEFTDIASGMNESVQLSIEAVKASENEESALDDLLID